MFEGLKSKWPNLWWIENGTLPLRRYDTFKGVHQGGDQTGEWGNEEFVKVNIRGRGTDRNGEFNEISGDAFPLASYGNQQGTILKEGDSPAMLYLLSPVLGGVGKLDDPTAESWGGRFRHFGRAASPNFYLDLGLPSDRECWKSINKGPVAFLSDWNKRWQWYGVNRPPRLNVSTDGRRLETEGGKPFVWVGDTAWRLFMHLNRDEAARYLLDRKSKGFTVIQAHLLGFGMDWANACGERAFHGNDAGRPNEAYFAEAVKVIDRAASIGLYMLVLPAWARMHVEGNSPALRSVEMAETYGRYVGRLLRDRTNVIWALGGDVRPARHEIYDALARGITEGSGRDPLMTYHPPGGAYRPPATSSGEFYHDKPWLDFNMIPSGHRRGNENYLRIAEDYARVPVKPVVDGEPCYEQHPIMKSEPSQLLLGFRPALRRRDPDAARVRDTGAVPAANSRCQPPGVGFRRGTRPLAGCPDTARTLAGVLDQWPGV